MLDPRGRQAELAEAFPHLTCWMCGKRMRNNYGEAWIGDDAVMRAVHARCIGAEAREQARAAVPVSSNPGSVFYAG